MSDDHTKHAAARADSAAMDSVEHSAAVMAASRVTLMGIAVNLVLAIVKGVSGVIGHSYALVADAIESLSDVLTSAIVFIGLRVAARPPDSNHPYGHGKFEPLASIAVAIALMIASVMIFVSSLREIITPHHAPAPFTLVVLGAVIIVKEMLFRRAYRIATETESTAVTTDAWHHRADALTSAFAFVGIAIALLGGKGWESADDWAAMGAAVIIALNAMHLLRPGLEELTDAAPAPIHEQEIRRLALAVPGVLSLDKCRVRKMGLTLYADLHVVVDGSMSVRDGHEIAHAVKDAIRIDYPRVSDVLIHIEPSESEDLSTPPTPQD